MPLAAESLLRQLHDLWVGLAKPDEQGYAAVLRACTMTLITVAGDDDDFSALGETLAALMPEHPARSIIVRLRDDSAQGLAARVYSQCWTPFGQRRQICCEQVEITASEGELEDAASLLAPLAVPDLPVVVWGRSARAAALPAFPRFAAMARKVIVDSDADPDPAAVLRRLQTGLAPGVEPADLAWTRLTRWREALARLFDNREYQGRLGEIARIRVGCPDGAPPGAALYLGAWAADCLAASGVRAPVAFEPAPGASRCGVASIALSGAAPGALDVLLAVRGGVLSMRANGITQCAPLPEPGEHSLLREELSLLREDPVYRMALSSALRLAISSGTR